MFVYFDVPTLKFIRFQFVQFFGLQFVEVISTISWFLFGSILLLYSLIPFQVLWLHCFSVLRVFFVCFFFFNFLIFDSIAVYICFLFWISLFFFVNFISQRIDLVAFQVIPPFHLQLRKGIIFQTLENISELFRKHLEGN